MAETRSFYAYDLEVFPKRDALWLAVVEKEVTARQQRQQDGSAVRFELLKDIQNYRGKDSVKHSGEEVKRPQFVVALNTEGHSDQDQLPSSTTPRVPCAPKSSPDMHKSSWTCTICLDSLPEKNPNSISCLSCQFCTPCLSQYIQLQIVEKSVNLTSRRTVRCPCFLDGCELSTCDVERIIQNPSVDMIDENRNKLLHKFHRFALELEVQEDPTKVFCPESGCAAVVALPGSGRRLFTSYQAKCQECKHTFCVKCNNSHSRFISCDMATESQFNRWRRTTRQGCKQCPGCHIYIEKNDGCSHMNCRACGMSFCWDCARPLHDGGNISCKVICALSSRRWGKAVATRTVTKTLALPAVVTVGGLAVGAAGVAAGLAVAAGGVFLCAAPFVAGYKYYTKIRRARSVDELYRYYSGMEAFLRGGVIIAFPSDLKDSYSEVVDALIAHMPSVTAGDMSMELSPPYRTAYMGQHVLYFTTTPSEVPSYDKTDYPFNTSEPIECDNEDNLSMPQHVLTTGGRGYIQLLPPFVEGMTAATSPEELEAYGKRVVESLSVLSQRARRL